MSRFHAAGEPGARGGDLRPRGRIRGRLFPAEIGGVHPRRPVVVARIPRPIRIRRARVPVGLTRSGLHRSILRAPAHGLAAQPRDHDHQHEEDQPSMMTAAARRLDQSHRNIAHFESSFSAFSDSGTIDIAVLSEWHHSREWARATPRRGARAPPPDPCRDQQRTRELLLDAAAQLFARKGFAATSVEEIAQAAGFTIGALYSNFSAKDELILELLSARRAKGAARRLDAITTALEAHPGDTTHPFLRMARALGKLSDRNGRTSALQAELWLYAARRPEAIIRPGSWTNFAKATHWLVDGLRAASGVTDPLDRP